jgi:quinol-cytochrome oxidoreductase complex cytochrome b subunit
MSTAEFELTQGDDARKLPVRVCVVQEEARPAVDLHDDDLVMTFPHLIVRELIALIGFSLVLVLTSLVFDAPLEELANPLKTPNPAKAPWYFLGLQELLHYYPPLVSGVILPGIVVLALAIVPYFDINLKRDPFWETGRKGKLNGTLAAIFLLCVSFYFTGAHPVWPIIGPTLVVGGLMVWPGLRGTDTPWLHWLGTRSLAFWIFTWFLVSAVPLTIIGIFFRGPGWSLTLPWRDGIYY